MGFLLNMGFLFLNAFVHFETMNRNIAWSIDSNFQFAPLHPEENYLNVFTDHHGLSNRTS